ncbi:MAG: glycosyltransferase family 87 protein [Candidatus Aminicenantes bacterium]|nr:glycosyltransferase family 87 protein [Candidatus Aminicenantes bacterium]
MCGISRFWWKVPRNRRILCGLLLILAAAAVYLLGIRHDMTDFGVCYRAGDRILSAETLYRETDEHLQFKYAPAAALFYAPFSALPWEAAKVAWFIVMTGCLAGILRILSRWAAGRGMTARWPLVWTVAVMAKCLGREFELGQVNILILLLLVLMLRETMAGREATAGLFWGLSLLFKPYGLIFVPYLILKKRGKVLGFGAAALLAGLLIPVVVYGWRGNMTVLVEWVRTLFASTPGLLLVGDNASLYAFIAKIFGLSDSGAMIGGGFIAAALGVLLLLMILQRKKEKIAGTEYAEVSVLMMLIPMLSPLGWNYNYLYGLPAVLILMTILPRFGRIERAVVIVNFILIGGTLREILGKAAFRFYTWHALVVPGFLVIFGMIFLARRRRWI